MIELKKHIDKNVNITQLADKLDISRTALYSWIKKATEGDNEMKNKIVKGLDKLAESIRYVSQGDINANNHSVVSQTGAGDGSGNINNTYNPIELIELYRENDKLRKENEELKKKYEELERSVKTK